MQIKMAFSDNQEGEDFFKELTGPDTNQQAFFKDFAEKVLDDSTAFSVEGTPTMVKEG